MEQTQEVKEIIEKHFKSIVNSIVRTYHEEINKFLIEAHEKKLFDTDIIVMIMNLTESISTSVFYSLKQYLPKSTFDFDFIKAKILNHLADSFNRIKEYDPSKDFMQLTSEALIQIKENGFAMVKLPNGEERKVTEKDILLRREDISKFMNENKSKPKLILPSKNIVTKGNA